MTLSSPVVPDERKRTVAKEKESGSKDTEAGQSTEGRVPKGEVERQRG